MINIEFSSSCISSLEVERYSHPHPKVQRRIESVYLKSQGLLHSKICKICCISSTTLTNYLKTYKQDGISGLKQLNYKGQPSAFHAHISSIENDLIKSPPHTISEASYRIEQLTGIKRSNTQVRKFLKQVGLKRLKVGHIPAKATSEKKLQEQDIFEKEQLQPRLKEAKEGDRKVFFYGRCPFCA